MARLTNKLMVLGLAGMLALPGPAHAGGPVVNTDAPPSSADYSGLSQVTNMASLNGMANLQALGGMANMNIGEMLMQSVVQAAVSQLTSQLLGQIGGMGGEMLGGIMQGAMSQNLGGLMGQQMGGLTSSFGGIQGGLSGGLGSSFGGLVQGAVTGLVQTGMQQLLGGMQGGSSGGGSNIGGNYNSGSGLEGPVLSYTTTIDPQSINYRAGALDAALGNPPDSTFLMTGGTWDTNYWAGYQKALLANATTSATVVVN